MKGKMIAKIEPTYFICEEKWSEVFCFRSKIFYRDFLWWKHFTAAPDWTFASKCFNSFTLRKIDFHFLSNGEEYDCGDSFLFNFEPNGFPFGSKSVKRKIVTTIIFSSIWTVMEINFSECIFLFLWSKSDWNYFWRLSASFGPNWVTPWKTTNITVLYSTDGGKRGPLENLWTWQHFGIESWAFKSAPLGPETSASLSDTCTLGWVEFQLFLIIGSKPMAKVANTLEYHNLNFFLI